MEDVKPEIPGVVPPVASQALALHQETNVSKVLKGWPERDCPKFTGAVGEDARDWLVTMSVLLGDRQAHPGLWHIPAGQRLSGKAFCDHKDAALAGTRPTDWVSFQSWLIQLSPLGPTPESVADELEKLKQGPNETCQEFYERFRDWQTKARTIGFAHNKRTCFVKRLILGLSTKVQGIVAQESISQKQMTMEQVVMTAMQHDQTYHQARLVNATNGGLGNKRCAEDSSSGKKSNGGSHCYNCKKDGHIAAKCRAPKSAKQVEWEKNNPEKVKERKKSSR
jgi:hypothetical protein